MIVRLNPGKFQAIIIDKKHSGFTYINLNVDFQTIKSISPIELSEINLDDN